MLRIRNLEGYIKGQKECRTMLTNRLHAYEHAGTLEPTLRKTIEEGIKRYDQDINEHERQVQQIIMENYGELNENLRSIPGIGLYMSRQLARSCCLRFAPANLDLETLKSLDPDQGGHLAAEVGDHRKHPLDAAASVDHHREHPPSRRWAAAGPPPHQWITTENTRCKPAAA